jgi:hypothetical protein
MRQAAAAACPILVEAMERHGHLQLTPAVRTGLLAISAATIDRALREVREPGGGRKRRHAPVSTGNVMASRHRSRSRHTRHSESGEAVP